MDSSSVPKDSTAVLGTKSGNAWEGVALTRDHKPNLKDEKQSAWDERKPWPGTGSCGHTFDGISEARGLIRCLNKRKPLVDFRF